MMQNALMIPDIADVIGPEDFAEPKHRRMFSMLCEMEKARTPIDIVTVRDELLKRKIGDFGTTSLEVAERLAEDILFSVPIVANGVHYAGIVREKSQRRRIVAHGEQLQKQAADPTTEIPEILEQASATLISIGETRSARYATDIMSLAQEAFDGLQNREHLTGVPTGFIELDDILSGLQPGELIVIGARPSMGKTAFGLNLVLHAAVKKHIPTMFYSLEMSAKSITQRLLCMQARVDAHKARRGMLATFEIDQMRAALDDMACPLVINDQSSPTVYQVRNGIRRNSRENPVRLVVIDYLQLMKAPRAENRQVAVAEVSRELKALARELSLPVVVLAQLNRQVEGRANNKPQMSDLRESGALEQDADVVLLLHREEYYNPKATDEKGESVQGKAQIIVAKQRNGPTGTIELCWHAQWTRFDNLSMSPHADETYRSHAKLQATPEREPLHARLPLAQPELDTSGENPF